MRSLPRTLGVLAVVSLVVLPFTPARASTIYGCVSKALGLLRIVSGPTACSSLENPISWNSQGPQGPQGPQGAPGPQGTPGAQGPAGVTAGIDAALFAEIVLDPDPAATDQCSVDFFRGADAASGAPTGNPDECVIDFTLPAGQPPSWGTAYECFTAVPGGYAAPYGTTCQVQAGFDANNGNRPQVYIQCLSPAGQPLTTFTRVQLLCVE